MFVTGVQTCALPISHENPKGLDLARTLQKWNTALHQDTAEGPRPGLEQGPSWRVYLMMRLDLEEQRGDHAHSLLAADVTL